MDTEIVPKTSWRVEELGVEEVKAWVDHRHIHNPLFLEGLLLVLLCWEELVERVEVGVRRRRN